MDGQFTLAQSLAVIAFGIAIIVAAPRLGRWTGTSMAWVNRPIWTRLGWRGDTTLIVRVWQVLILMLGAACAIVGILQLFDVPIVFHEPA